MQRFENLDKWHPLKKGAKLQFSGSRKVRLKVSSPAMTAWYTETDGPKSQQFLTVTTGQEVLEFTAKPGMALMADEDCIFSTSEGMQIHLPESGSEPFTKVANRKARNPELERVAALAAHNATVRMEKMHQEELRRMKRGQSESQRKDADDSRNRVSDKKAAGAESPEGPEGGARGGTDGGEAGGELSDSASGTGKSKVPEDS